MKIYINNQERTFSGSRISYKEVVGDVPGNHQVSYTWRSGKYAEHGWLQPRSSVEVVDQMEFRAVQVKTEA